MGWWVSASNASKRFSNFTAAGWGGNLYGQSIWICLAAKIHLSRESWNIRSACALRGEISDGDTSRLLAGKNICILKLWAVQEKRGGLALLVLAHRIWWLNCVSVSTKLIGSDGSSLNFMSSSIKNWSTSTSFIFTQFTPQCHKYHPVLMQVKASHKTQFSDYNIPIPQTSLLASPR